MAMEWSEPEAMVDAASGPERPAPPRRPGRAWRIVLVILLLGAGTAVATPVYRGLRAAGCEPRNWIDWHLAMRRQCLTKTYVCEHMTSARMLEDPDVAAAYRAALAAGSRDPVPGLVEMVDRLRLSYGCAPEREARLEGPGLPEGHPAVLPPGHPPIPRGVPSFGFEPAPTTTL
jgi:hypothetical protein